MTRGMSLDANGKVIPQSNGFTQKDANATAQPVTATADTPVTIVWPDNAIALAVYPIGSTLFLADPDDPTFLTPMASKTWQEIPGKPNDVTTLKAVSTATTFYYRFEVLK